MGSKISKAEVSRNIARAIIGDPFNVLPGFPSKFHTIEASLGARLYLEETEPDVVEFVHENRVANTVLEWVNRAIVGAYDGYNIGFRDAVETARIWRAMAMPVDKIKNVSWPGETGLTFRRLPWPLSEGAHPTFDEMMHRTSNSHALKCFIGSLLNEDSYMQQYVWIHGAGQDGKGALSRFLHKVLANAYSSQVPPMAGDKFWTSMIMGKRLVVFPDCNNQGFVTSGLFKSLTGGDPVRVEQKQQPAATAVMTAKYMFLSNERPNLSSEKADQRRVIYCEMQTVAGEADPGYDAALWAEGGAFLAACMIAYAEGCPRNGAIPVDKSDTNLSDLTSMNEEEFETAWEQNFYMSPTRDSYAIPSSVQDRLNEIWPRNRKTQSAFRSWMERVHTVRKKTAKDDSKIYPGLQIIFSGQDVRLSQAAQAELQKRWPDVRMHKDGKSTR